MAPGEGLSNEDIYMASWYDDLLKRQEYEAIQGRPTFKPNAFQEMFTPKGMEYQWQDRVADSGEVSTGDIEDLRMVRPGLRPGCRRPVLLISHHPRPRKATERDGGLSHPECRQTRPLSLSRSRRD